MLTINNQEGHTQTTNHFSLIGFAKLAKVMKKPVVVRTTVGREGGEGACTLEQPLGG